jgi:hypothetical protein
MKRLAVFLLCLVSAGTVLGQQARPSSLQQARDEADNALRRESDLTAGIAAQERANVVVRNQLRKSDLDPAGLQKDLVEASADAAMIRRKVAAQKLRYDIAADNLTDARANAARRLDQSDAVRSAQRAFDDAAAEMERLSQPILEQLEQTPQYQEAQALADAAAQTGEALQGFDTVDPKAQADADAAYDQALAGVRALEDAAIDADPKASETNKAVKKTQETLVGLRAENERRIASDPRVDGAKFAFDTEKKIFDESSAELAGAEKRLSALRQAAIPKGGAGDLAMQLKDGEDRLHAMSDQLEQARAVRREADEKLRYLEDIAAANANNNGDGLPPFPLPQSDPYGNYGAYPPPVTYVYPTYPYSPYDNYYCPPYYGSGIFFGTTFYSRSYCYPRYYNDRFCGVSYYHNYRNSSWRNSYDYWRGRGSFGDVRLAGRGDGRFGISSRATISSPVGRANLTADSRLMTDYARHSSSVERDESGTRVSTYGYPGSSTWRLREAGGSTSSRSGSVDDSRGRGTITITRTGSRRTDEERSVADDSGARHASYSDSSRTSRVDSSSDRVTDSRSGRSVSSDSSGSRSRDVDSHSSTDSRSSADSGRARGGDSTARSSSSGDSARSRGSAGTSIGSTGGSAAGASRSGGSGGGGSPSYSAGSSRGSSPAPSGGSSRGSSGPSSSGGGSRGGGSSSGGGGGRGR